MTASAMFLFCSNDSTKVRKGNTLMELLRRIERHLIATNTPPTRFGRNAVRDPRLVHDMRRGREPGARMIARVIAYIEMVERGSRS